MASFFIPKRQRPPTQNVDGRFCIIGSIYAESLRFADDSSLRDFFALFSTAFYSPVVLLPGQPIY